uniref:Pre-mRNA-splicing factor CWC24 n=1 Tax=Moniliophthora roreri TaxID=221103 RepID=A0A0W0EYK7_MONRR
MSSTEVKVPFFKKKSRPTTGRKRSASPSGSTPAAGESSSKSEVVLPTKKASGNLLSAGTKRKASERDADDGLDAPEKDGPDVKWTSAGSHINTAIEILAGDELEELMSKRRIKEKEAAGDDEDIPDDGQYRGQKAYKSHIQKNKEVPKAMRVGPQRSTNSTIRTVTIVDYQPDKRDTVDSATRANSCTTEEPVNLAGWQLDKLADNPKKQVGEDDDSEDSDSDDEDIPFACLICRKHYTDPVVTRCGHYFCSSCAIKRFAKTPKCAACNAPTGGMFNRADKVIAKVEKKRKDKEDKDGAGDSDGAENIEIEGLGAEKAAGDQTSEEEDSDED